MKYLKLCGINGAATKVKLCSKSLHFLRCSKTQQQQLAWPITDPAYYWCTQTSLENDVSSAHIQCVSLGAYTCSAFDREHGERGKIKYPCSYTIIIPVVHQKNNLFKLSQFPWEQTTSCFIKLSPSRL